MRFHLIIASMALAAALPGPASAHEYKAGALTIGHPWARATPPGAEVGAGYLTVANGGTEADVLVSATLDDAAEVMVHESMTTDGVATMRPAEGVAIAPGEEIVLEPGGLHLMFMGLSHPLKEGEKAKGSLTFRKAGTVEVEFAVGPIGDPGPDHSAH